MSCRRRLTAAPVSSRNVAGIWHTVPWIVKAVGELCGKTLYVLTAVSDIPSYARPVAPRGPSFPDSDGDERGLHTLVRNDLVVRSGSKRRAHGLVAFAAAGYNHGSDHATTVVAVDEEEQVVVGFV